MEATYKYTVGLPNSAKYMRELPLSIEWMKDTYGVGRSYIFYFQLYSLVVL